MTTADVNPARVAVTAVSIDAMVADAFRISGNPACEITGSAMGETGSASLNTSAASEIDEISRIGISRSNLAASVDKRDGASNATKTGPVSRSASQAFNETSPPIPAGSPIVSAIGLVDGSKLTAAHYTRYYDGSHAESLSIKKY